MNFWSDRNSIPPYGGSLDSSASKNPSQNSGAGLLFVLGGVNLNGNQDLQWGAKLTGSQNNAFCAYVGKKPSKGSAPISDQPDAMGVYKYVQAKKKKTIYLQTTACKFTFTVAQTIAQRGLVGAMPIIGEFKVSLYSKSSRIRRKRLLSIPNRCKN